MTIAEQDIIVHHVVGTATDYAVPFAYWGEQDLKVWHIPTGGLPVLLAVGTDYDLDRPALSHGGGVVRLRAPLPAGQLVIRRETRIIQGFSAPPNARGFEHALDRMAMVLQEQRRDLSEGLSRTLRTPEPVPELPAAAVRAGRVLGFDGFGQPTIGPRWDEIGGAGSGPSGGAPLTSLTVAMHADWQPIYGAEGPDQLDALFRVFDEQRRSFPEIRDADVLGDSVHRAGSGSGEIEFFRSKGLPEGATDQPGDAYPWGLTVVFNGYMERTGIGFGHLGVLRGNHCIDGRWVEYNPLAAGFAHHEAMFGPGCFYRRRGNMVWIYVGQEAGGVGGQVSDTTIEWLDEEISRMDGCHIHFWTHHPILGCSPTPPDYVLGPVTPITAAHVAEITAGGEPEIVVGEYWDPSEISTQLFLGDAETGVFLEHEVDFEYVPYIEAPEDAPEEIGDGGSYDPPEGEIGPSAYYKIRILRGWSRRPLVVGDSIQIRTIPVPMKTMDAWTSHLLLGTEAEPGLLRRHADKIRVSAYGHTGDLANPTHRIWLIEPNTGIPMFNNNMALNGRVEFGHARGGELFQADNPLVYTIAHYDALARRATFRRWNSTAQTLPDGSFEGAWLKETHPHLDCDLTVDYPHHVDLGGGEIFDSRRDMSQQLKARQILVQRDISEAAPRRTLTGEPDADGFRQTQPGVGGPQAVFVADLGDRAGRDSQIEDAVEFVFKTPTGRSPGRGFYYRRNASRKTLVLGVGRSRGSEHLAKGRLYVAGERADGLWRNVLSVNVETGLVSAPEGVEGPLHIRHRPAATGGLLAPPQIVGSITMEEGGRDLVEGEERWWVWRTQPGPDAGPGGAVPVALWGWASRRISGADEDLREEPSMIISWEGNGVMSPVWRLDMSARAMEFSVPLVFATPEAAAATLEALGGASYADIALYAAATGAEAYATEAARAAASPGAPTRAYVIETGRSWFWDGSAWSGTPDLHGDERAARIAADAAQAAGLAAEALIRAAADSAQTAAQEAQAAALEAEARTRRALIDGRDLGEYAFALADDDDRTPLGVLDDGSVVIPGRAILPGATIEQADDPRILFGIGDDADNLALEILRRGGVGLAGALEVEAVENPLFDLALVDDGGRIGWMTKGAPVAVPTPAPENYPAVERARSGLWIPGPRHSPKWRAARSGVLQRQGRARVLLLGDSNTGGTGAGARALSYGAAMTRALPPHLRATTDGHFGGHYRSAGYSPRLTLGSGWGVTATGSTEAICGVMFTNSTSNSSLGYAPKHPYRVVDLWALAETASEIIVSVGGTETPLSLAPGGLRRLSVSVEAAGLHPLEIRRVSGSPVIAGFDCHDGEPGVSVVICGRGSWRATDAAERASQIEIIAPDLTLIQYGLNDFNLGNPPEAFAASLRTLAEAALSVGSAALVAPFTPDDRARAYPWSAYAEAIGALAESMSLPLLDLSVIYGPHAEAVAAGLVNDGLHPSALGYGLAGEAAARLLIP